MSEELELGIRVKPGDVFLLYHDYVYTPFLIFSGNMYGTAVTYVVGFGSRDCYSINTFYLNGGRVLKRKFTYEELADTENVRFIGGIELTKFILDILEKRGRHAERLLDAIFDYVRGQETTGE